MTLSEKSSKMFVEWYKNRYKWYDTPIEYTSQEMIWISEEEDRMEWEKFLRTIIPDPDKVYKQRPRWAEKNITKVLNSLRLNYWPKCDSTTQKK
jgi:hypothetical protein